MLSSSRSRVQDMQLLQCSSTNPKCSRGSYLKCSCSSQLAFCPLKTWDPNKSLSWLGPQLDGVCSCWWPAWDLSAWNQPWPVYSSAVKLNKLHVFGQILHVCSARWARPWTGSGGWIKYPPSLIDLSCTQSGHKYLCALKSVWDQCALQWELSALLLMHLESGKWGLLAYFMTQEVWIS